MEDHSAKVSLKTTLNMEFFSLAMSFVEESAKAYGLGKNETIKLRLACEEIFVYLSESDQKDKSVIIEAENGVYFVGIKFLFDARNFDPHAFNLTARTSFDTEADLKEMGLIIASRSVDKLNMLNDLKEGPGIELIKEKFYPEFTEHIIVSPEPVYDYDIFPLEGEAVKFFVYNVLSYYPQSLIPQGFSYPGKVVDMIASNKYRALVASDKKGNIAGGILWRSAGTKMVEMFGPYTFAQPAKNNMADELVNGLLTSIARTDAVLLVDLLPTPELPKGYFEFLGSLDYFPEKGDHLTWQFYYRHLREDTGMKVWSHPDLIPFLNKEYKRLAFARNILKTGYDGEVCPAHSLFSARFDRILKIVSLSLMHDGKDAADIIDSHIKIFKAEGINNIIFRIDLAYPWQANLVPVLTKIKFVPRFVLPHAGTGDMVIFQYIEGEV